MEDERTLYAVYELEALVLTGKYLQLPSDYFRVAVPQDRGDTHQWACKVLVFWTTAMILPLGLHKHVAGF